MVKLEHNGEVMDISVAGEFAEVLAEFTELGVALFETIQQRYGIEKSKIIEDYTDALKLFIDMPNLYMIDEEDLEDTSIVN